MPCSLMNESHENLDRVYAEIAPSERSFGLVFSAVFGLVGVWPALEGETLRWWSLAVAAALLAIVLFRPRLLSRPNLCWMRFGALIGKFVSPLVLGITYFFMVVPVGFFMRIAGKDPLRLRFQPKAETYWIRREPPGPEPGSLTRQF